MEVVVDRDEAERRLGRRADECGEREPRRPAWEPGRPARAKPGEQRQREREQRDRAVPELHERVVARLGEEASGLAPRPRLATEARGGEPHDGAGDHDDVERRRGRGGEYPERRGRELEGPYTPERRGLDVHRA